MAGEYPVAAPVEGFRVALAGSAVTAEAEVAEVAEGTPVVRTEAAETAVSAAEQRVAAATAATAVARGAPQRGTSCT